MPTRPGISFLLIFRFRGWVKRVNKNRVAKAAVSRQKARDIGVPDEFFRMIVTKMPDNPQKDAANTTKAAPTSGLFICVTLHSSVVP